MMSAVGLPNGPASCNLKENTQAKDNTKSQCKVLHKDKSATILGQLDAVQQTTMLESLHR